MGSVYSVRSECREVVVNPVFFWSIRFCSRFGLVRAACWGGLPFGSLLRPVAAPAVVGPSVFWFGLLTPMVKLVEKQVGSVGFAEIDD